MYARIATFESDPSTVDEAIAMVRSEVEAAETPPGLEGAKMLMLVDRESGRGLGITLFADEAAMRRGDEGRPPPGPGGAGGPGAPSISRGARPSPAGARPRRGGGGRREPLGERRPGQ